MESWPSFLPPFRRDNYQVDSREPVARESLVGSGEQREISDRSEHIVPSQLELLGCQILIFEYFMRELCNEGCATFNGKFLNYNGEKTRRMRLINGAYQVNTMDGYRYTVTCRVELLS